MNASATVVSPDIPLHVVLKIEKVAHALKKSFNDAVVFILNGGDITRLSFCPLGDTTCPPLSSDTEDALNGNLPLAAGKDRHSISPAPGQCRTSSIADSGAASAVGAGSICAGKDAGEQDKEGGAE